MAIQRAKGTDSQFRIFLVPCSESNYESTLETKPPTGAAASNALRYAMTPDGDVYPHALMALGLSGLAALDETDHIARGSEKGAVLRKLA